MPLSLITSEIVLTSAHLTASQSRESMVFHVFSLFPAIACAAVRKLSQLISSFCSFPLPLLSFFAELVSRASLLASLLWAPAVACAGATIL